MRLLLIVARFLHDLATVVWFGGLFTLSAILIPSARKALGTGPQLKGLLDSFQERLSRLVYVSMVILVLTGVPLARANRSFLGLFRFGNTYSAILTIKHILVALMIILALVRSRMLVKGSQADEQSRQKQQKLGMAVLYINMLLGIGVLLLSSMSAIWK